MAENNIISIEDILLNYADDIDKKYYEQLSEINSENEKNNANLEKRYNKIMENIENMYGKTIDDTKERYFKETISRIEGLVSEYNYKIRFLNEIENCIKKHQEDIRIVDKLFSSGKINKSKYKDFKEIADMDYQSDKSNICSEFFLNDSINRYEKNKSILNANIDELVSIRDEKQKDIEKLNILFEKGRIDKKKYNEIKRRSIGEFYSRDIKKKFGKDSIIECANNYISSIDKNSNIDSISLSECLNIKNTELERRARVMEDVDKLSLLLSKNKIDYNKFMEYADMLGYSDGIFKTFKSEIDSILREKENEESRTSNEFGKYLEKNEEQVKNAKYNAKLQSEKDKQEALCKSIIENEEEIINSITHFLKKQEEKSINDERELEIKEVKKLLEEKNKKVNTRKNKMKYFKIPDDRMDEFIGRLENDNISIEYFDTFNMAIMNSGLKEEIISDIRKFNEFVASNEINTIEERYNNSLKFKNKAIDELKTRMNGMLSGIIEEYNYQISDRDIVNEVMKKFELTSYISVNDEYENTVSLIEEETKDKRKKLDEDIKEEMSNYSKNEKRLEYIYVPDEIKEEFTFYAKSGFIPIDLVTQTETMLIQDIKKKSGIKKINDEKDMKMDIAGQKLRNSVDVISILADKKSKEDYDLNIKTQERIDKNDSKVRLYDVLKNIIDILEEHNLNITKLEKGVEDIDDTPPII